jgi:hypothetical protein
MSLAVDVETTCPLTNPIPVYNVDGTANDAGAITDIANVILRYETHSERTQLAVTCLGKQSLILGYNWLHNHNPNINWQTKCKGTSVHSLTSPASHYVYMYSPGSLYISDHTCTTPTS